MHTEIELKLLLAPADVDKFLQHPLLNCRPNAAARSQTLRTIYFDSAELELAQWKIALRLRQSGQQWIMAVKGGGSVENGLHRREEWEVPVAGGEPDCLQLADSPWGELFNAAFCGRLQPIFETHFTRTTWLLGAEKGEIELALDIGQVKANNLHLPLCEIELELKAGEPAAIYEVAKTLQSDFRLKPENQSKAEKGYQIYRASH